MVCKTLSDIYCVGQIQNYNEVCCANLPKPGWQSPGGINLASFRDRNPTVWIDDMQVEFVEVPGAKLEDRPLAPSLDDDPDAFGGLSHQRTASAPVISGVILFIQCYHRNLSLFVTMTFDQPPPVTVFSPMYSTGQ